MIVGNITWIGQNTSDYSDKEADGWIAEDEGKTDGPIAIILPRLFIINPLSVKGDTIKVHFDSWFQVKEDVVEAEISIKTESDH